MSMLLRDLREEIWRPCIFDSHMVFFLWVCIEGTTLPRAWEFHLAALCL